eukprot:GGOE01046113.1.p2 GENE.GGOE01046113.1~~GGOE01046113.1.p2  ORF type:complete len:108 (-),score=4.04 GGOE01046113.1:58-381(-)
MGMEAGGGQTLLQPQNDGPGARRRRSPDAVPPTSDCAIHSVFPPTPVLKPPLKLRSCEMFPSLLSFHTRTEEQVPDQLFQFLSHLPRYQAASTHQQAIPPNSGNTLP